MRLLTQARETFTVVGDDDQSIYSWRGAKPENLVRLQTDFPRLQLIKLEQNYRSTNTILTAANHLIQQNTPLFPKSLWSQHGQGDAIRVIHTASEYAEAEFVAGEIAKLHGLHHVPLHHFAILYRGNFQAQWIEEQLQVLRLPYTLSGGTSMFSRIEIRDLICYLRVLTNPQDDAAFLRIANTPKRGIGPALCETLRQVASNSQKSLKETLNSLALLSHLTAPQRMIIEDLHSLLSEAESRLHTANLPSEVLNPLLQKIDYQTWLIDTSSTPIQGEKRWNQVERFIQWMDHLFSRKKNDDPNFTLSELLSTLMLMDQLDQRTQEEGTEHIQLMTLHAAKGLEFPRVYIIGVEENLLPHKTSIEEDTLPEERRLAYVGITRAQTHLTLTLARTRQSQGEKIQVNESRFLQEIPSQLLSIENPFELGDTDQISDRNKNNLDLLKSKFLKKSSS
jgi:ATP-dependent DNA helicase Rep